ncbi:MAG: C39 family peptidase [Candidatus Sericytochromatia bacterium]
MSLNGISPNFASKFEKASQDGMITNRELKDLSSKIQDSNLPQEEKDNLISTLQNLSSSTSEEKGSFIFKQNILKSISDIDVALLKALSNDNEVSNEMIDKVYSSQKDLADPKKYDSSDSSPNIFNFGNKKTENNPSQNTSPQRQSVVTPEDSPIHPSKLDNFYLSQFSSEFYTDDNDELRSEKGDCGPTSAAMILRANGFDVSQEDTRIASGVTRPRDGAWAIDQNELVSSVEELSGGQIKEVDREHFESGQKQELADYLKSELSKGNMPVLLTGTDDPDTRHYTVVIDVKEDNTLVLADPALIKKKNEDGSFEPIPAGQSGLNEYPFEDLDWRMSNADRKTGTFVMSFAKQ